MVALSAGIAVKPSAATSGAISFAFMFLLLKMSASSSFRRRAAALSRPHPQIVYGRACSAWDDADAYVARIGSLAGAGAKRRSPGPTKEKSMQLAFRRALAALLAAAAGFACAQGYPARP